MLARVITAYLMIKQKQALIGIELMEFNKTLKTLLSKTGTMGFLSRNKRMMNKQRSLYKKWQKAQEPKVYK